MQVIGLCYVECDGRLVREVLDNAVRGCVESAAGEGREEDGRCACLRDFEGEGCEVGAVVC